MRIRHSGATSPEIWITGSIDEDFMLKGYNFIRLNISKWHFI